MSELGVPAEPRSGFDFIVAKYRNGFFPYMDFDTGRFFWDRKDERTVVRLTPEVTAKADRMLKVIRGEYAIEENRRVELVLTLLSDERVKKSSWVKGEIVEVYRRLADHGLLRTIEVVNRDGLMGAILCVDLFPVLLVETMLTVQPNGSKIASCDVVKRCAAAGYQLIDVQCPHKKDHPFARLLEQTIGLDEYLTVLRAEPLSRAAGGTR